MKEKNKNKMLGEILTVNAESNINSNNSVLSTSLNKNNTNNKIFQTPSSILPSKGGNHHKRAHSSFKFKNISENNKNTNTSNKINLNTIIANINNYNSLNSFYVLLLEAFLSMPNN